MAENTGLENMYEKESTTVPGAYEGRREPARVDVGSRLNRYVKSRVADQIVLSGVKLRKTAGALKKTGKCFSEEEQRIFGRYVTQSADRIEDFAMYLQDTSIDRIIDDFKDFSVKQPWLLMGAGFSAGILLARVIKASQSQS